VLVLFQEDLLEVSWQDRSLGHVVLLDRGEHRRVVVPSHQELRAGFQLVDLLDDGGEGGVLLELLDRKPMTELLKFFGIPFQFLAAENRVQDFPQICLQVFGH